MLLPDLPPELLHPLRLLPTLEQQRVTNMEGIVPTDQNIVATEPDSALILHTRNTVHNPKVCGVF